MDLIGRDLLEAFTARHVEARVAVDRWEKVVRAAHWRDFTDLRRTLPTADQVKLGRELVVTIFNVGGNKYRLISEVSYANAIVRALMVLTHTDYDRERWKRKLQL